MINIDSPRIEPFQDIPLKEHQLALIYKTIELEEKYKEQNLSNFLVLADLIKSLLEPAKNEFANFCPSWQTLGLNIIFYFNLQSEKPFFSK